VSKARRDELVYSCNSYRGAGLALMIFRSIGGRARVTALLAAVLSCFGCASASSETATSGTMMPGAGGAAGTVPTASGAVQSVAFDPSNLTVAVLEQTTVTALVAPARGQTVAFALVGNSLDSSLDLAQVACDADGLASVTLTASSLPTTFSIRASLDRRTVANAQVTVVDAKTGSIEVAGKYRGTRQIAQYLVGLYPDKDCSSSSLDETAPDRILASTTSLPVHIDAIPLARPLAVVVDGDESVHGCAVVRGVPGQSSLSVEVPLDDLPINVNGAILNLSLSTVEGLESFKASVSDAIPTFVAGFSSGNHDLVALLAAMESTATGSLQQEFSTLRSASGWDSLVVDAYAAVGGSDLLRRQLRTWLNQGVELLSVQPTFDLQLSLGPLDYSAPVLALVRIAGVATTAESLKRNCALALNPESNDQLSWSSTLTFDKATLLDQLAFAAASVGLPGAQDVPDQLGERLNCQTFAAMLDDNAAWTNSNARVCTATCLAKLCGSGLSTMHDSAMRAVLAFGPPVTLLLNASGTVVVDSKSRPVSTAGTWIGALSGQTSPVAISGTYESR
jgi:hypothetical protein